jgi:hypothetical protein
MTHGAHTLFFHLCQTGPTLSSSSFTRPSITHIHMLAIRLRSNPSTAQSSALASRRLHPSSPRSRHSFVFAISCPPALTTIAKCFFVAGIALQPCSLTSLRVHVVAVISGAHYALPDRLSAHLQSIEGEPSPCTPCVCQNATKPLPLTFLLTASSF